MRSSHNAPVADPERPSIGKRADVSLACPEWTAWRSHNVKAIAMAPTTPPELQRHTWGDAHGR